MNRLLSLIVLGLVFTVCVSVTVASEVVFQDDFESYADNAALTAAYDTNTITGLISSVTYSRDVQSVSNPHSDITGSVLTNHFTGVKTGQYTLTVSYWAYDSAGQGPGATGSSVYNGRAGLSLGGYSGGAWGTGSLENYVFFGMYHGVSTEYYGARIVSGGGGWQTTTAPRSVGWHKFTMVLNKGIIRCYIDDGATPVLTDTFTEPASGWNCFRLGSPAGQTYVDTAYDDVDIQKVRSYAGPYAGLVKVDDTSIMEGDGLNISYVLSYEADSANIEIIDATKNVIASFAGTANAGLNTVPWDGTDDNSGGTVVAAADGCKIRVEVANSDVAGWVIAASNSSSAGTLFSGFSPNTAKVQLDEDRDTFGTILVPSCYSAHAGCIVLQPDLSPVTGDGYDSRVFRHPNDGGAPGNGAIWGLDYLPDSDVLIGCGQDTYWYIAGTETDTNASDASNGQTLLTSPRDVEVVDEDGQLWAYSCGSSSVIDKFKINSAGIAQATSVNVLSPTSMGASYYSKDLEFDAAGNMYWVSRDGYLYRWSSALVKDVTDALSAQVISASADWVVDVTTALTNRRCLGCTIVGDMVYLGAADAATSTNFSLYEVGNVGTSSLTKTITSTDQVFIASDNLANGTYGNIDTDPVGNLITHNRAPEEIWLLTPGGETVITTIAPLSQTFDITPYTSVRNWNNY